ncbi:MAG: type II toxin-antitoxin system PemK/MazF family toxin, partial [Eubacteriaceae bacterium]
MELGGYFDIGCWLSKKLNYHRIAEFKSVKEKNVNPGEVWFCDLGYNIGAEKNKRRPVMIVSNGKINRKNKVLVACITDAKNKLNERNLPAQDSWYLLFSST